MANSQDEINRRINNLFNNLQKNPKSIFYLIGNLSKTVINKASKSFYEKNKVLVNFYNQLEDKSFKPKKDVLPVVTPFNKLKSNVDHSTLFSIGKPFELLHADIADTRFLARSAIDPNIVFCWLTYLLQIYLFIQ